MIRTLFFCLLACFVLAGTACAYDANAVLIFGGKKHERYIGCISCDKHDAESVWNDLSDYGWGNKMGVWNKFGEFKNAHYAVSACNPYATDPPVLVDAKGKFYGLLTLNKYLPSGVCLNKDNARLCRELQAMCTRE